jgi:Ice-binding-like
MVNLASHASRRIAGYSLLAACLIVGTAIAVIIATQSVAGAAVATVNLGTAGSFGVLAGSTVTNTGATIVNGDLGVSPGTAITGFPPGVVNGAVHDTDGVAAGAQSDLTTAYNDAAGRSSSGAVGPFIGAGQTLDPGVYNATTSLDVGGQLTLNAHGDPDAVWIFQVGSTLVTDSASSIRLTGGAQACNVFWQVGSSATLGTGSSFQGSVLALTSITVTTGDTIIGRALARNGAVTLDDDVITVPACTTPTPTPTPTTTSPTPTPTPTSTTPTPTPSPTRTRTPTPTPSPTRTRTPTPSPSPTRTRTPTPTPSPTRTRTPTPTPSPTRTRTPTPTPSPTRTKPTPRPSPTRTRPTPKPTPPAPVPTPIPTLPPITG